MATINVLSRKTQVIWKFCQNTGNFAQVVNPLILKMQDIAIFAAQLSNFAKSVSQMKMS